MNDQPAIFVSIEGPGEAVAAIPYLLGFHPTDSVVALTITSSTNKAIEATLRADLPHEDDYVSFAHHLALSARQTNARGVMIVVVGHGESEPPNPLPYPNLIEMLQHEMMAHGIAPVGTLWAAATTPGSRWHCYDHTPDCHGFVPSPDQNSLAAATVAAGHVTFASRAEFEGILDPDNDVVLARRSELIAQLTKEAHEAEAMSGATAVWGALDYIRSVIQSLPDDPHLNDETVARLAVALSISDVRALCLGESLTATADAAERLWTYLVRATPASHRAHPAVLLAVSAFLRGNGALADLALARAEETQGDHVMALFLRVAVITGIHPKALSNVIAQIVATAERDFGRPA